MSEAVRPVSAIGATSPSPKRRKVRKGTLSCWECKRRKTRCSLATSSADICDGCRSRGIKCISQGLPDEVRKEKGKPDDTISRHGPSSCSEGTPRRQQFSNGSLEKDDRSAVSYRHCLYSYKTNYQESRYRMLSGHLLRLRVVE